MHIGVSWSLNKLSSEEAAGCFIRVRERGREARHDLKIEDQIYEMYAPLSSCLIFTPNHMPGYSCYSLSYT